MDKTSLGDRMKRYEGVSKHTFTGRTPIIIRIDGKAFHSYTKPLKNPFNDEMNRLMSATTKYLVENIQCAVLGYTQSDEISILLRDWDTHTTQQWFDGKQSKIESVAASMATGYFNWMKNAGAMLPEVKHQFAMFDARAFTLPKEEVCNYFIWRQQDASRNSVQMLGHYLFSTKEMHGKNNSQVQDMLMLECGINWNDLAVWKKRGTCVERVEGGTIVDSSIPIFTSDRSYIEKHLEVKDENPTNPR